MSRLFAQAYVRSGITVADSALPGAPVQLVQGASPGSGNALTPVSPIPTGVVNCGGANAITVDVLPPNGASGNTGICLFAWNQSFGSNVGVWSQASPVQTVPVATAFNSGQGTVAQRVTFTNWASEWVFVAVTALATGGGAGVGTAISVVLQLVT